MPDPDAASPDDRLPLIVICDYDADDPVWDPVEDLSGTHWRPPGARVLSLGGEDPERLFDSLSGCLRDGRCRALVLVGRTSDPGAFRIQMRAENRDLGGTGRLSDALPSLARTTLPVAGVVEALNDAGLSAKATSEAEPDAGSYLLFRALSELPDTVEAPAIGLLRIPREASEEAGRKAIKATAAVVAAQLSPISRLQHA